ncbi:MAG: penicillin-binding protein 2, partial [Rhodospirillaceae bacterium]|nr:penicillin-binding protein 2 [Rhodospirillaceae bacterium]
FAALGIRLAELTAFGTPANIKMASANPHKAMVVERADIRDRNGVVIASSLPTRSLYVDPKEVIDPADAAQKISKTLGDISAPEIMEKIDQGGRFQWVARNLTPVQVYAVNRLGLPGFGFRSEEKRVYPFGPIFAHVLGYTDVDGRGISGVEKAFESKLGNTPTHTATQVATQGIDLSLDTRIQAILREEILLAKNSFSAIGGAGVVMDVKTGEVLALVSLPDFDPNESNGDLGVSGFNRATKGVYEMGSTLKLFATASALDSGAVGISDGYDTSEPIKAARFTINDLHGKKRWLSIPEILVYSSNIGTAKMALDIGVDRQKSYLKKFGMLDPAQIEIPEIGHPLYPDRWSEISAMTISYGHGIAVSPLQVATGVSAIVNGGVMLRPTIIKRTANDIKIEERVISPKTSKAMRAMMRLVVRFGTGKNADVKGYMVGGKTGTAEKQIGGEYLKKSLVSSFVGAFPMNNPRYVVFVMLDEPKGIKSTFGYATGGWVAAPVVSKVISRMGALKGIMPQPSDADDKNSPGTPLYIEAKATKIKTSPSRQGGAIETY